MGALVSLRDSCRHCLQSRTARVAKAATNAEGYRRWFLCTGCGTFRGYVSKELETYLADLVRRRDGQLSRPIPLGTRKAKPKPVSNSPGLFDAD
jgi:hypothetical protein